MKTFHKYYLPETIQYNGKTLKQNYDFDGSPIEIIKLLKQQKRTAVLVEVLSRNLRGRTNLHGLPYKPSKFIFST